MEERRRRRDAGHVDTVVARADRTWDIVASIKRPVLAAERAHDRTASILTTGADDLCQVYSARAHLSIGVSRGREC